MKNTRNIFHLIIDFVLRQSSPTRRSPLSALVATWFCAAQPEVRPDSPRVATSERSSTKCYSHNIFTFLYHFCLFDIINYMDGKFCLVISHFIAHFLFNSEDCPFSWIYEGTLIRDIPGCVFSYMIGECPRWWFCESFFLFRDMSVWISRLTTITLFENSIFGARSQIS